jgi:nicotinamidase-related amidase
LSRGIGEA